MGPQEEYIETVFTCEGNFYDPDLHARLEQFHRGLKDLLLTDKQKLVLKKVEPWNSVRVTFNIPREAALRLKHLAQQGDVALRELGVLAVQIEGDQLISLTIAGHNNERTELVFKTSSSSHSATMPTPLYEQIQFGANKERSGNVPPTPSSKKDVSKFISPGLADSILNPSIPASEVFRSPNVVASSCEPIPFRPNSVINSVPFSRCSTTTTTSALPPGRSPTGYPASQSQGLLSCPGTSRSPIGQPGLKFPSPPNMPHVTATTRASVSPVSLPPPPPYPISTAATTTTTTVNNVPRMCKPVTSSSPLLVNLLQTDATSVPFNNLNSSKMLPPPDASPPKRKRRQRKIKETKNSGLPVLGAGDEHSAQNMPHPALNMYNISTNMVTGCTNTLSTSAVNLGMLSAPNVTCPSTAFNPKACSTVSAKSQIPDSLLVNENIHRKSNVTANIQQSSIGKPGQISTALSKESSGVGKLINPHTGHLEPVDEGSPSRSESLQDINPTFENQLISGELFGAIKSKLPVNSQESESGSPKTMSPCPNSLPNKNAYIYDSLGHHNSINLIKSTGCGHVQQGNSKEQMSPSVGLNGQNLFAPSKPSQNVTNSAVAAFHSNYTKDLNKLFAPESKSVPITSAPHLMSGGEMVINKTSNFLEANKPETGQFVNKKTTAGQGPGGRKQRKSCVNNASKTSKAERHSTTWGSDKHNVPFYKNFSDKGNPSGASISTTAVSAMIHQNAAKASSQGKFAGMDRQDRPASNDHNSLVNQCNAVMSELNQILESPDSNKMASLSDAESENSNQSSITGSVPVVSNPFPDMNTNVKNVMSLSHDSGLGSVSEPSDDTPSESGDSEILKSTLKSNCKDDHNKLFENALYVMHEQSDGVKMNTSNYTFPGSSISSIHQQQQQQHHQQHHQHQPQQIGNSQIPSALHSNSLSSGLIGTRQVQQQHQHPPSSTQVPSSAAGRELCTSASTKGQLVLSNWTTTTASSGSNTVPAATTVSTISSQLPPYPNVTKVLGPNVPSTQNTCSSSVSQLSTSLHSYFTTSPSAISSCNATVSSVFDSRPFCAHLTTSQVTPEHLTTMASQQGSLAASTTWCNPIIPYGAKMAGGLPGGESSISKEQLKPLTTGSVTISSSSSSLPLVSSQGKYSQPMASTCALTTTTSSSPAATSVFDQFPRPMVGKSLAPTESLDQSICHHALSTLTFPALPNDLDKAGLSQELSKLTENKSTDFSSCGSEKLNSLINTDTTTALLYPMSRTYSTWKSNASFSHLLPSDVSDHINKSIVSEEFGQRKMQVDCNNGLNGGIFLSQPGEAKEIEISVCGSVKDTSSPSVSDKCTMMEKTTVQVTVADLSNIPSGGLSAILSSNSANIDPCLTSSNNSGSSSANNNNNNSSTCTASIAPVCTINSLKSLGGMSCQDSAKGSNITSIYTKRSSSTAVSTVNCLPHLYAPDLPLPKRLTESVQRLVKPIPSSDHSLPRVRKSPVSSSIRQQTASTSTSPRSSPHHGKHTSLGSPRAQTVVDHIITSSHASVSPLSSSLSSSQNSWAVPPHTSAPHVSTMHNITQSFPPPQVSYVHSTMAQLTNSSDHQPHFPPPQVHHTREHLVTQAAVTTVPAAAMVYGANRLNLSNLEPRQLAVDLADDKSTEASERLSNSFDVPISLNTTQVLPQQLFPTVTSTPSTTTVLTAVVPGSSQHCDLSSRKFDRQLSDQLVNFITSSASKGSISSASLFPSLSSSLSSLSSSSTLSSSLSSNTNNTTITPTPSSSHTADMIHGTSSVSLVDSVGSANIAITSIEATSPTYVTAVANQVNLITATIAGQSPTLSMLTNESQQLSNSCVVSQSMCLNLENAGLQSGAINSDSSCSNNNMLGGETNDSNENNNINNNNNNNNTTTTTSITVPSSDNSNNSLGQQGISSLQGEVCSNRASEPVSEQPSSSSATITSSVTSSIPVTSPSGGAHNAPLESRLSEGVHSTVQDNGKRSIENSADKSDKRLRIVVEGEKTSDTISPMETSCSSVSVTNASDSDSAMTCLEVAAPVLGGASVQESSSTLSSAALPGDAAATTTHSNMEVDTSSTHPVAAVNSDRAEATNASHPNRELSGPEKGLGNGKPHHLSEHSLRERDTDVNRAAINASGAAADGGVDTELKEESGATLDSKRQDTSLHKTGHEQSAPAASAVEAHATRSTTSTTTLSTTTTNTITTHKTSESKSIVCNDVQTVEATTSLTMADGACVANDSQHGQQQSLTTETPPVQMDGIEHNVTIADGDPKLASSSSTTNANLSQAAVPSGEAGANPQEVTDKKENLVTDNCIPSLDSSVVNNQEEAIENSATKPSDESGVKVETPDSKEPLQETKPQPLRRGRPVADRNASSSTRERSPVRVRNKLCDAAATSTAEPKEELPNEPLKRSTRGSTRPKGFSGVRSRCPLGCEDHKSATPPRVAPPPPPPPPHTTTTTPGPGCAASKNLALPRGVDTSAPISQIKCGPNDAVHLVITDKD